MNISFICALFPPEPEPSGVMAAQLARRLCAGGHKVTMIVPFPNRPHGRLYEGYRRRLRKVEDVKEGYSLVRCVHWFIGRRRLHVNRLLENITFGLSSAWSAWRQGRPDVIVVETWPLFAVQCAASLSRWWRVPLLYYVKDVYPEVAERTGIIRDGGFLARMCRLWDRRLCLGSAKTVVISETMRDLLATSRNLDAQQFAVIADWVDPSEFGTRPIHNSWRREQNIPPATFVAMFGGTLGNVSGVEILIEVARLLRADPEVLILCIGEGIRKAKMVDRSRSGRLDNIRFLPFQPRPRLPEVQGAANAMLLTVRPGFSDASVPSKLISYLAAGRPVICAAPAESAVARIVLESDSGVVVPAGDAACLATAIVDLSRHPADAERMGRNARAYFEQHMTLDRAYGQFLDVLAEILPAARAEAGLQGAAR